eukprot:COSAG02_NODE_1114_length_14502_cov_140.830035_3_plen_227_part_00
MLRADNESARSPARTEAPSARSRARSESRARASPRASARTRPARGRTPRYGVRERKPHMNESGRDRDSQMIPGAWTQSSVANPTYGTRTCTAEFAPRRARNGCAKAGAVSSGAQTGGETGGWRRGCRGKTRAVRCPPTPLAPSASVRSIAGWVCGVCGVCPAERSLHLIFYLRRRLQARTRRSGFRSLCLSRRPRGRQSASLHHDPRHLRCQFGQVRGGGARTGRE